MFDYQTCMSEEEMCSDSVHFLQLKPLPLVMQLCAVWPHFKSPFIWKSGDRHSVPSFLVLSFFSFSRLSRVSDKSTVDLCMCSPMLSLWYWFFLFDGWLVGSSPRFLLQFMFVRSWARLLFLLLFPLLHWTRWNAFSSFLKLAVLVLLLPSPFVTKVSGAFKSPPFMGNRKAKRTGWRVPFYLVVHYIHTLISLRTVFSKFE